MLASSQTIAPKPAALPPAAQPALPGGATAGGPSFAQFLNDQPTLPTPPAHTDPVPPREADAADAPAQAAPPATATARRPAAATQAKPATPAQGKLPEQVASTQPEQPTLDRAEEDTSIAVAETTEEPETAGLQEFTQLIGLTTTPQAQALAPAAPATPSAALPAATVPAAEASADQPALPGVAHAAHAVHAGSARHASEASDEQSTSQKPAASADTASTAVAERGPAEAPARDAAPRAKAVELAAADKAAARSAGNSEIQQTGAAPRGTGETQAAAAPAAALPTSFAAVLAQAMPGMAAAADIAPASASGQVHAALHSNAFAPELGARVSLFAVDGVQQAELQLNPADMGPVSVQIVIDGSQAQVSFHAAQAETRQALEQSLPDLAAALQGQGLTLSGGGVFQQAQRDPQGGDAEAGHGDDGRVSRTNTGGGRSSANTVAAPVRRSVGLLDTFA